MQFSDTSNLTGLVEDIDFICGTDSTSYPLKDKARNGNRWLYKAVVRYMKAQSRWQYDDTNQTGLPVATTDLVDSQGDYALPSTILQLEAVEVQDTGGNWSRLAHIDTADISGTISDFEDTAGMPKYYDLKGESIILYPAPSSSSVTTTAGLKIYYTREFDAFASTDTTQQPGIPEPFHRIVSLGASYDWLVVNDTAEKASAIRQEIEQLLSELDSFAGERNKEDRIKIRPKVLANRRDYR